MCVFQLSVDVLYMKTFTSNHWMFFVLFLTMSHIDIKINGTSKGLLLFKVNSASGFFKGIWLTTVVPNLVAEITGE